ncbi:hypothetical protein [robinz microvirus RP_175]|nr:hypothetical protein [robinz microvirus RP_175]
MPLDKDGREVPDTTPVVLRFRGRETTNFDDIRQFIRREMSDAAARGGQETFEEANDFDVGDDDMPKSPHEYSADQEDEDRDIVENEEKRRREAARKAILQELEADELAGRLESYRKRRGTRGAAPTSQPESSDDSKK